MSSKEGSETIETRGAPPKVAPKTVEKTEKPPPPKEMPKK